MKYEWEGIISFDLPEGWILNEEGDVIEVVPPDESGALHISIFDRHRQQSPNVKEASELVQWFQHGRGGDAPVEAINDRDGVPVARSHFDTAQDGEPMSWVVLAKIWPDVAVLATYAHDPKVARHRRVVERSFDSIERVGSADPG